MPHMISRALVPVVLPMLLLAGAGSPWHDSRRLDARWLDSPGPSQSATDRAWQQHADRESQWRGRQMWLRDLRDAPLTPPRSGEKSAPAR